jgi:hypothetical protein
MAPASLRNCGLVACWGAVLVGTALARSNLQTSISLTAGGDGLSDYRYSNKLALACNGSLLAIGDVFHGDSQEGRIILASSSDYFSSTTTSYLTVADTTWLGAAVAMSSDGTVVAGTVASSTLSVYVFSSSATDARGLPTGHDHCQTLTLSSDPSVWLGVAVSADGGVIAAGGGFLGQVQIMKRTASCTWETKSTFDLTIQGHCDLLVNLAMTDDASWVFAGEAWTFVGVTEDPNDWKSKVGYNIRSYRSTDLSTWEAGATRSRPSIADYLNT